MLYFVHNPERYGFIEDEEGNSLINIIELIVAKNRNGRICDVRLSRDKAFTTVKDIEERIESFDFSPDRLKEFGDDPPF